MGFLQAGFAWFPVTQPVEPLVPSGHGAALSPSLGNTPVSAGPGSALCGAVTLNLCYRLDIREDFPLPFPTSSRNGRVKRKKDTTITPIAFIHFLGIFLLPTSIILKIAMTTSFNFSL